MSHHTHEAHLTGPEIRSRLGHPIIDGDAHINEFYPGFLEAIDKVGGPDFGRRYREGFLSSGTGGRCTK